MTPTYLMRMAVSDVQDLWRRLSPAQNVVMAGALAFLASGLFHIAVWLMAGAPSLEGPVSWRKPIVFGFSTGLLSLSLAWVIGLLPQTKRLWRQAHLFVWLLVAELSLIAIQQWRGVGSHFNSATPLDGAIFTAMGVLIMIAAVVMAIWTRAIFKPLPAAPGTLLSARAAMVLLNLGNVMGVFIAVWGSMQLAAGLRPNIVGEAGQLKVPHALALHAMQVLPLIAWLASRGRAHLTVARLATVGYAGVFAFTLVQTFSGRAPHDVTIGTALLLAVSLLLMGWAAVTATVTKAQPPCDMLPGWDAAR